MNPDHMPKISSVWPILLV